MLSGVLSILEVLAQALNSGFGSALAGAFFGALAASYFAVRFERKRLLLDRLMASNAATSLAIAVFQHSLGFKDQFQQPIVAEYLSDRERFINFQSNVPPIGQFAVEYNFGTVPMFRADVDKLLDLALLKSGADQKTVMAATYLLQTIHSLEVSIVTRNEQLKTLSELRAQVNDDQFARHFFGVEDAEGNVDVRLLEAVKAIQTQLDDTIFYSKYIAERMSKQNIRLARSLGRASPEPISFGFNANIVDRLLPDDRNYPDWQ